ncbi:unnamed protein product, partial [Brenthis ino]
MDCAACCKLIVSEEAFLQCMVRTCQKTYHELCTGILDPASVNTEAWICPECACMSKRGGDNSLTPVGASRQRSSAADSNNITYRKKAIILASNEDKQEIKNTEVLRLEIKQLREEIIGLKNQLNQAMSLLTTFHGKCDNYFSHFETLIDSCIQSKMRDMVNSKDELATSKKGETVTTHNEAPQPAKITAPTVNVCTEPACIAKLSATCQTMSLSIIRCNTFDGK